MCEHNILFYRYTDGRTDYMAMTDLRDGFDQFNQLFYNDNIECAVLVFYTDNADYEIARFGIDAGRHSSIVDQEFSQIYGR